MSHIPVMLNEVIEALNPKEDEVIIDGTFGAGGYTKAILQNAPNSQVIAIDRDVFAYTTALSMASDFKGRLHPWQGPFSKLMQAANDCGFKQVDGIVLDIGVSSMQIDQADRGFSFQKDGPLDMRMDTSSGQSAAEFINTAEEEKIADVVWRYGEERASRKIAKYIVENRPFKRTLELAKGITKIAPNYKSKTHAATKTFQALRIFVNDELGELEAVLGAAEKVLKPEGRLVVVTFHSLEDRIVKNFLKDKSSAKTVSRYQPLSDEVNAFTFEMPVKSAIKVSKDEAEANLRARSAKLRWAKRTSVEVAS